MAYELDLTILKMYLHSKTELSKSTLLIMLNVRALQTDNRHRDRQTDMKPKTLPRGFTGSKNR